MKRCRLWAGLQSPTLHTGLQSWGREIGLGKGRRTGRCGWTITLHHLFLTWILETSFQRSLRSCITRLLLLHLSFSETIHNGLLSNTTDDATGSIRGVPIPEFTSPSHSLSTTPQLAISFLKSLSKAPGACLRFFFERGTNHHYALCTLPSHATW